MSRHAPLTVFARAALLGVAMLVAAYAAAQPGLVKPPDIAARGYILMDADTVQVLAERDGDLPLPPASLTKIMTSFVAASELEAARISLSDVVPVSVNAWSTPGSRMFIREGTEVSLENLLHGVIIQSGNDASVAVAEYIAGAEDAFANMMNDHAAQLGMANTHFANSTGLPNTAQHSTARDMALLTRALIQRFPEHYAIYSKRQFKYNDIEQPNRNRLLWRDRTVDGVKTGHTAAAGYCLVASAKRDGMRLISAVMGADSDAIRVRETQKLLQYGFRYFETRQLYDAEATLKAAEVWYGEADEVAVGVPQAIFATIQRGRYEDLEATLDLPSALEAPIAAGDELGELRVMLDDELVAAAPLIAKDTVAESGFFSRMFEGVVLFFKEFIG